MVPNEHVGGDAGPDDQEDLLEVDNDEEPVAGPSHSSAGPSKVVNTEDVDIFLYLFHSNGKLQFLFSVLSK